MSNMKIKKLHIEKYKSLEKVDVELSKDVNIFIGKNNSGKSNIIGALMFLSDIGRGDPSVAIGNQGGFKEIVFGKDIRNEIKFDSEIVVSDEEMSALFSKLQLEPKISFEDFKKSISNKIRYIAKFGADYLLVQEEVHIYFNEMDILYAKGFWNKGDYERQIIKDLKEGINNGNWELTSYGAGTPPDSILHYATSHSPIQPKEYVLLSLHDFFVSFNHLNPVRSSSGSMKVRGGAKLTSEGSNLPQVLNSIASSNRKLFETIMKSTGDIIEEITEIRAPLVEGSEIAYLSIVEPQFDKEEFTWIHISSGVQEILYLITLLHTTPKGSLLMIEEPEIHLHPEATNKFLSLIEKICEEDDKQILITTHSPMLVDAISFDKMHIVTKQKGVTHVNSFKDFTVIEKKLVKQGILKSWLLLPQAKLLPFGKFILVVEDNDKMWKKFIENSNLFSNPEEIEIIKGGKEDENGGWTEAIKTGVLLKLLCNIGILSLPFMIVLDSDNKKGEKEKKLQESGFSREEHHVLSKKEIEDYLLDARAISRITGRSEDKVSAAISKSKGGGKEKLKNVFRNLDLNELKVTEDVKVLLVENMEGIPDEISLILSKVKRGLEIQ
jgi:predicted ATPase